MFTTRLNDCEVVVATNHKRSPRRKRDDPVSKEHIMTAILPTTALSSDLFIGGQWKQGAAGSLENVDPGNGETIGVVTLAHQADVQAALDAAAAAFCSWSERIPAQRGAILKRAAAILQDRFDEASVILLRETGKTMADARGEILRAIDTLAWNGEQAGRIA